MVEEFRQQREVIESLEKQAERYKTEGKEEAGKRLEYQLKNLKVLTIF